MQYRVWFMHGTSHWLGMNVHDVGGGSKFVTGATFTNEPGIYVRLDALDNLPKTPENQKFIAAVRPAFEKYKGIGVRIEDDMLVTPTGVSWMTGALPRKISDIESVYRQSSKITCRGTASLTMLTLLNISNVALIDQQRVDFEPGLNLLTGETGCRKINHRRRLRCSHWRTVRLRFA